MLKLDFFSDKKSFSQTFPDFRTFKSRELHLTMSKTRESFRNSSITHPSIHLQSVTRSWLSPWTKKATALGFDVGSAAKKIWEIYKNMLFWIFFLSPFFLSFCFSLLFSNFTYLCTVRVKSENFFWVRFVTQSVTRSVMQSVRLSVTQSFTRSVKQSITQSVTHFEPSVTTSWTWDLEPWSSKTRLHMRMD